MLALALAKAEQLECFIVARLALLSLAPKPVSERRRIVLVLVYVTEHVLREISGGVGPEKHGAVLPESTGVPPALCACALLAVSAVEVNDVMYRASCVTVGVDEETALALAFPALGYVAIYEEGVEPEHDWGPSLINYDPKLADLVKGYVALDVGLQVDY